MITDDVDQQALHEEIAELEQRLENARRRLNPHNACVRSGSLRSSEASRARTDAALHTLLLLADSALPLGSFAFSSGLESYLAHHSSASAGVSHRLRAFHRFLYLSLHSLAGTALPYVLASYRSPHLIATLDNDMDASTPCTVARRASVAQGRALLAVWDRSLKNASLHAAPSVRDNDSGACIDALAALGRFQAGLRAVASDAQAPPNGHFAPLWGLLTRVLGVDQHEAAYMFLFSHARAVTSAAVRASVLGPYQAQAVLANADLRDGVGGLIRACWETDVEHAAQSVPVLDLWVGRHEKLYSRIFNS